MGDDFAGIGLFSLAQRRLAWISERQSVLAQNIANADTPGYQPRDLAPFSAQLTRAAGQLARTDPRHMAGPSGGTQAAPVRTGERAPDGNAVALEHQLSEVAEDDTNQQLVSSLYTAYAGMVRTAIGK